MLSADVGDRVDILREINQVKYSPEREGKILSLNLLIENINHVILKKNLICAGLFQLRFLFS